MAQCAGIGQVTGSFVTGERSTAPGWERMSGVLRVTIFTTIGQTPQCNIKARIAAGASAGWIGMAFLTVSQIGFGFRTVQTGLRKRKRVRGTRSFGVAAGRGPVGVGKGG